MAAGWQCWCCVQPYTQNSVVWEDCGIWLWKHKAQGNSWFPSNLRFEAGGKFSQYFEETAGLNHTGTDRKIRDLGGSIETKETFGGISVEFSPATSGDLLKVLCSQGWCLCTPAEFPRVSCARGSRPLADTAHVFPPWVSLSHCCNGTQLF